MNPVKDFLNQLSKEITFILKLYYILLVLPPFRFILYSLKVYTIFCGFEIKS